MRHHSRTLGLAACAIPSALLLLVPLRAAAWVARYHPRTGDARSPSMAVDRYGNTYLATSIQAEDGLDYLVIKYRPDGTEAWTRQYDGPGSGDDIAAGIAVDTLGRVFVTGTFAGVTGPDLGTTCYTSTGERCWVAYYDDPDHRSNRGFGVAALGDGGCVATGPTDGGGGRQDDILSVGYDSTGRQLWVNTYHAGYGNDCPVGIVNADTGLCYVAGASAGSAGATGSVILRFDSRGLRGINRYDPDSSAIPRSLRRDHAGNLYITGSLWGGTATGWDAFVLKYNRRDSLRWSVRYNAGGADDHGLGIGIDLDTNGYLAVLSFSNGTRLGGVGLLPSGGVSNIVTVPVSDDSTWLAGDAIAQRTGGFILIGSRHSDTTAWDYYAAAYDTFWERQWETCYDWAHDNDRFGSAFAADTGSWFQVTGLSQSGVGNWDVATLRWDRTSPGLESPPAGGLASALRVAPNPAREFVDVDFGDRIGIRLRVRLFDPAGRLRLDSGPVDLSGPKLRLTVDRLPPGVYLLRADAGTGTLRSRLLVSR